MLFGVDIASISAFAFLSDFCRMRSAKSDSACLPKPICASRQRWPLRDGAEWQATQKPVKASGKEGIPVKIGLDQTLECGNAEHWSLSGPMDYEALTDEKHTS